MTSGGKIVHYKTIQVDCTWMPMVPLALERTSKKSGGILHSAKTTTASTMPCLLVEHNNVTPGWHEGITQLTNHVHIRPQKTSTSVSWHLKWTITLVHKPSLLLRIKNRKKKQTKSTTSENGHQYADIDMHWVTGTSCHHPLWCPEKHASSPVPSCVYSRWGLVSP